DEDAAEWRFESVNLMVRLERFPLTSECVAVDGHVHEPEESGLGLLRLAPGVFRQEDASGARPHDRHPFLGRAPYDLIEEAELHQQLRDRRALAAGDREPAHGCHALP